MPLAVDVGCGTGQKSTIALAKHFEKVIGLDKSGVQLQGAKPNSLDNIEFRYVYIDDFALESDICSSVKV